MADSVTNLILTARLADLDRIIASGVSSGSYEGKNVTFRSMEELATIRDGIVRQIGLKPAVRRTVIGYSGGF